MTKEIEKLAEKSYNLCVVLKQFCEMHHEISEIANISPIVSSVYETADKIYSKTLNYSAK